MAERIKLSELFIFSKVGCGEHSLYPAPYRISILGTLEEVGVIQLLYVSKHTFNPFAPDGMPNPCPNTNPVGGASKKLKAIPSAAVPPFILKSNSAFHLLQSDKLIG